jgi:hypothetical protein
MQHFGKSNRFGVPAPKSSAIPNFAKPGYSVKVFSDVVKHVVKSHFRPQILKSQGRKVLEPQRFFGLRIFPGTSDRSAPKSSALPTDGNSGYGGYYTGFPGKKQSLFAPLGECVAVLGVRWKNGFGG